MSLYDKGRLDAGELSVEFDRTKELTRLLDEVVIRLEGGGDPEVSRLLDEASSPAKSKPPRGGEQEADVAEVEEEAKEEQEKEDEEEKKNGSSAANKTAESGNESGAYSESDEDEADGDEEEEEEGGNVKRKKKSKSASKAKKASSTNGTVSESSQVEQKQLHKTVSIFMRNLAPQVTKQDLEAVCRGHEGFKRIAISDPAPERGFQRRGWVTFEAGVDVKKICWSLQSIKVIFESFLLKKPKRNKKIDLKNISSVWFYFDPEKHLDLPFEDLKVFRLIYKVSNETCT